MYVALVNEYQYTSYQQQQHQQQQHLRKTKAKAIQVASDVDKWHLRNIQKIEMINIQCSCHFVYVLYKFMALLEL